MGLSACCRCCSREAATCLFLGPREPSWPGGPHTEPPVASWGRWERRQHTCTQKFSAHLKVRFNRYLVLFMFPKPGNPNEHPPRPGAELALGAP